MEESERGRRVETLDSQGQGKDEGGRSQGGIPSRRARVQVNGRVEGGRSQCEGLAAGTRGMTD